MRAREEARIWPGPSPRNENGPAPIGTKPPFDALVRVKGVEPSRGCPHMDLNHARLPFRHTRVSRGMMVAPQVGRVKLGRLVVP